LWVIKRDLRRVFGNIVAERRRRTKVDVNRRKKRSANNTKSGKLARPTYRGGPNKRETIQKRHQTVSSGK